MHLVLTILHLIGAALGVGGATVSDSLFLASVRNRRVGGEQYVLLRSASRIVIAGLGLTILSGLGFLVVDYLDDGEIARLGSAPFLAKMTMVAVIAANGVLLHFKVIGFLEERQDRELGDAELAPRLWLMAGAGAASVVSWYGALILGIVGPLDIGYPVLLGIYALAVAGAAIVAYLVMAHAIFWPGHPVEAIPAPVRRHRRAIPWILAGMLLVVLLILEALLGRLPT